jgi:hypothetical protein
MGILESRINIRSKLLDNGCIEYTGYCNSNGYGLIAHKGPQRLVHRVVWELVNGPIPEGLCVCHTCDNKKCINLEHLWIGTIQENILDKCKKGREYHPKGELNGSSILTADDVITIRSLYPKYSQHKIAKIFGVSYSNIWSIVNGETWGWL